MASGCGKTRRFFETGTLAQFEYVLGLYDKCLKLKADSKSQKPENIIKLDKWYQNELPKKIKSRGKDPHLIHDELVQTIKWKLARGKFRPNLTNLVQMNTPRVVMNETKKAFRQIKKKQDLQAGVQALCNLKGVGPAMASAVLAAGAPDMAPFMADEVLWALPDVDSLDYTMKEYNRLVDHVNQCLERLNEQGATNWNPHKVELAVWTYYIANDLKPELLEDMPGGENRASAASATPTTTTSSNKTVPPETEDNSSEPITTNGSTVAATPSDENGDSKDSTDSTNNESQSNAEAEVVEPEEAKPAIETPSASPEENGSSGKNGSSEDNAEVSSTAESSTNGAAIENGNKDTNGASAATNGDVTSTPQENGTSKDNSSDESSLAKDIMDQSEENTNDSTKENKEATKRPAPADSSTDSAESHPEPASKKLKAAEGESAQPDLEPQTQQSTPLTTA